MPDPADLNQLELEIADKPDDLDLRIEALERYFEEEIRSEQFVAGLESKRLPHIKWMIRNHPNHWFSGTTTMQLFQDESSEELNALWREQVAVHADQAMVLRNAARALRVHANNSEALPLLERAFELDPTNPEIIDDLAGCLSLQIKSKPSIATRVFQLRKMEFALHTEDFRRFYSLTQLAKNALDAHEFEAASHYAAQLLEMAKAFPDDWNYGNAIFVAHIVLGRVALHRGNLEEAARELVLAGKIPGSPQLNSFGPDFSFADELLKKGRRPEVLQFLKDCQSFWEMDRGILEEWQRRIANGETPHLTRHSET